MTIYFFKKKYIYPIIYRKINIGFSSTINYNAYQGCFKWIKKRVFNIRYHRLIKIIKKKNNRFRNRNVYYYKKFKPNIFKKILFFLYIYNFFFFNISLNVFYFLKKFKKNRKKLIYRLILTFRDRRLFVNLQNFKKKNYLFISSGFFIKFFEKKKSLKKKKNIKLLIAKFLRKLYLISKVKYNILIIKKNPVYLIEFLTLLNSPIIHKFINPFGDKIIEEKKNQKPSFKILYFIFFKNQTFVFNKQRKKGRIKRKIFRKIVLENSLVD